MGMTLLLFTHAGIVLCVLAMSNEHVACETTTTTTTTSTSTPPGSDSAGAGGLVWHFGRVGACAYCPVCQCV